MCLCIPPPTNNGFILINVATIVPVCRICAPPPPTTNGYPQLMK